MTETLACATCMGHPEDPAVVAANMAVVFMLVILFPVLAGFASLIVVLAKRQKQALAMEADGSLDPSDGSFPGR